MTTEIDMNEKAKAVAEEVSKPGKFSLIERLAGRNMPTDKVTIYLDDAAAYELTQARMEHADSLTDPKRLAEIDARIEELETCVAESAATIHLRAISTREYEEILAEVEAIYPTEYEVSDNVFTGRKTRQEKPNPEREIRLNTLYLSRVITSAEFGSSVDDQIDEDWVEGFMNLAPLDAVRRITEKAYELRMVSGWMDTIQADADF